MPFILTFIKKTAFHVVLVVLGILGIILSFAIKGVNFGSLDLSPVLFVIGVLLLCWSVPFVALKCYFNNKPQAFKQAEIDIKDERSVTIKDRARAKAGGITQWFIIGIAFMTLYMNAPEWATFVVLGVFCLYHVLTVIFMVKYKKEM